MHTTNYANTFIEVAEDCKVTVGTVPPEKSERTMAQIQYDLISQHPYKFTSDDVIFMTHAEKKQIEPEDLEDARAAFFSKGQACLRASPLGKTYGWGVHANADSKVAIYAQGSEEYRAFARDASLKHLKAMRSSR
jgi:Family of unknown function (DUF6157)